MTAPREVDPIKQAATILSLLDSDVVERVRAGLTAEQRGRLDAALEQAREAPDEERARLVRSFTEARRSQPKEAPAAPAPNALETPKRAQSLPVHKPGEDTDRIPVVPTGPPSFAFVTPESVPQVAACLVKEMPQVAAVVLQRVPPHVARAILKHLPEGFSGDVAVALTDDAPAPAPGALGCIARVLEQEVGRLMAREERRRQGMLTVARALASSETEQAACDALHALAQRDEHLAHNIAALLGLSLREAECARQEPQDEALPVTHAFSTIIPAPQLQVVPDC